MAKRMQWVGAACLLLAGVAAGAEGQSPAMTLEQLLAQIQRDAEDFREAAPGAWSAAHRQETMDAPTAEDSEDLPGREVEATEASGR
jgi:hypothetical protein